jgi:aspartate carbamoyltransferase
MHIISINDITTPFAERIFHTAKNFKNNKKLDITKKHLLYNLFYEPSTRTSSSFYAASTRLGGSVIPVNDVNYSSVVKGEDLEDTIMTAGCYADIIVLRHPETGAAERASVVSPVPLINAGDGNGEHPTQTLLDAFTIWEHFGILDNLEITMMGDLKNGRTVHSLVKFLSRFSTININLVAPERYQMPAEYVCDCCTTYEDLEEVAESTDVLYMTRVQQERGSEFHYELTEDNVKLFKENMIVMHPLPRNNELPKWFDLDPRARYFTQMRNGMFIRMALLYSIL